MTQPTPTGPRTLAEEPDDGFDADVALLTRVRSGQAEAYGPLFDRHHGAALALARRLTRSNEEAEEIAATAFDRVIRAIENGKGPTEAFRPYLLTAVRRTAWRRAEQTRRERGVDDDATLDALLPPTSPDGAEDADQALALEAFKELPERWQLVLWHTLVEDKKPGEVAPLLGLSPNATAALAVRAREGLREAYLQRHLTRDVDDDCQFTVDRLGASVRGNLGKRDRAKVDAHLQGCARCRQLESELGSVNGLMRSVIGPAVLGVGLADYRAGWNPPTDLTSAHSVSFRWAAGVGVAAALVLTVLGLRTDLGADAPGQAAAFADSLGPDDGGSISEVVELAIPVAPVDDGACDGPIVPVDLPVGSVIVAARTVMTGSGADTPADTDGTVATTPISNADAAELPPAEGVTVIVTERGLCGDGLVDIGQGVGLLLSVEDDQGSVSLALVHNLIDDVVDALQTVLDDTTGLVDGADGDRPLDGQTPTITVPPGSNTPGVQLPPNPDLPGGSGSPTVPLPTLPAVPGGTDLPSVGDLVDQLTSGGLL